MKNNRIKNYFSNIFIFWMAIQLQILCCKGENKITEKIYGEIGKDITIKAEFKNIKNKNISIRWEPVYSSAIVDKRFEIKNEINTENLTSILKIINFHKKDEDIFLCYLNNEETISIDHKTWVEQLYDIKVYARIGQTIKFITNGFVKDYFFDWFQYKSESEHPIILNDYKKYLYTSANEISNLTIRDLTLDDTAKYSLFYLERNPWNVFELNVLDDILIQMKKFHYFQNSSEIRKEIVCRVYAQLNETISFHICNTTLSDECSNYELITSSDNITEIKRNSYENGVINYILLYPYKHSGKVKCSSSTKNSKETVVKIASFPSTFSITPYIDIDQENTKNTNENKIEILKNGTVIFRLGREVHLECAVNSERFENNIKWLDHTDTELGKNNDQYTVTKRTEEYLNTKFYISTLSISPLYEEIEENYTCSAYSSISHDYVLKVLNVVFKRPERPIAVWIIIKLILLALLLLLVLIEIVRKIKAAKRKSIFPEPMGLNKMADSSFPLFDFIKYLPYDKSFEFPEKRLTLGKCLGYGNFGMVHQGIAKKILPKEEKTLVAVKTVKDVKNSEAIGCLISEMKIMIHLGKHLNVVNLLGAITKNVNKGELMVIVEYCRYGNLEMFLRNHRSKFINQIDPITDAIDPKITKDLLTGDNNTGRLSTATDSTYIPSNTALIQPSTSRISKSDDIEDDNLSKVKNEPNNSNMFETLTTTDLICWAYQITRGMDFISKRNIMHGDLAARNILLADDNIVKICDFGLAKTMSDQYGNYIKKQGGQLPVKWLAIESLQDNKFSIKSDVWSFGILLWELFSLGCTPYPGISARDFDFVLKLKSGYRMEKPEYANQELYDIMMKCWQEAPEDRPKFSVLENNFEKFLEDDIYTHYIHMNEPYLQANEEYFKKQDEKKHNYLTILNAPNDAEPKYLNDVSGYLRSVRNFEKKNIKMNRYVKTPLTENLQFDFRDNDRNSPRYENNFNSLKKRKS
ncbi:vascular endothelial growth factor receptor 2-like isoform X2 [Condylostylus longicornis]|uniref:vascular endothelial growth factor receptor 2-like isoform X2 n=1 Tax=Condylostylus longicornis TaxID=2530218 RepID=UPI00244E2892|nr:vascular endothelial growth factor receptor 2-like isoform X2 [Condylostylus longicornis]